MNFNVANFKEFKAVNGLDAGEALKILERKLAELQGGKNRVNKD